MPDKPYQLTFVTEQYIALACLRQNDWLFKQFPKLKIIICHCGGALDRWIPNDPHLSQKDLADNLFYDTCAHDAPYLESETGFTVDGTRWKVRLDFAIAGVDFRGAVTNAGA